MAHTKRDREQERVERDRQMARTMTQRTMTKRTSRRLVGQPGLQRKADRLEAVIRRAINQPGRLAMVCAVLVDKGNATTGSRVPLRTLAQIEAMTSQTIGHRKLAALEMVGRKGQPGTPVHG